MTNNNVHICGWCGVNSTTEFCSTACKTNCIKAYEEDMLMQQTRYDNEAHDMIEQQDREEYIRNCTDTDVRELLSDAPMCISKDEW